MLYSDEQLRRALLDAALAEWATVVRDDDGGRPGNRDVITGYFEACRWGFHIPGGYVERRDNPWCGIFAGAMGRRVGDHLEPGKCVGLTLDADVCLYAMPSTERLASLAKWKQAGAGIPVRFRRASVGGQFADAALGLLHKAEDVLVPGAIATVMTSGNKPEVGDHVVIVESYDPQNKTINTVEGNGRGKLGDGTHGEGVVRCVRKLEDVVRVVHLGREQFESLERP